MPRILQPVLLRISEGDTTAFREVFDYFSPKVYGFALKLTHSDIAAEEIVQETFLKIWTNRSTLSGVTNFQAYLYTIARNLAFNALKKLSIEQRAISVLEKNLSIETFDTEQSIIYRDYQRVLRGAIDRLSPQQKLVYKLCHGEGLKYEEAARKLKISRLTVKTHMQQALRTIKLHVSQMIAFLAILIWFPG